MAQALYKAPAVNFGSTSLNGAINSSVDTITLNSTSNLKSPGYVVIDRQDSTGANTPNAREVVSYTGISGNDLTGCTRPADGSTARSHADGALVEPVLTTGMWNDQQDFLAVSLATVDGTLRPVSTATITTLTGSFANFISGASLSRLTGTSLYYSNATLTNLTVTNSLLLSGVSIQGSAWASYTPTLTNITLGNGSLAFRYSQVGKTINLFGKFIFGSTSSISGVMGFSLPATPAASAYAAYAGTILDSGTAFIPCRVYFGSDTRLDVYALNASGTYLAYTATSSTVPMTWAAPDEVTFYLNYEAV